MVQACQCRDIDTPCHINLPKGRAGCNKPARRHASGFRQHVVFVYKGIRSSKTDQSCDGRRLVEELPLAGLHNTGIVHTRSYRGGCCLAAHPPCMFRRCRDGRTGRSTMQLYGWKEDPDAEQSWIASLKTLGRRLDLPTYQTMSNRGQYDASCSCMKRRNKVEVVASKEKAGALRDAGDRRRLEPN
jgi:hypothetical protein